MEDVNENTNNNIECVNNEEINTNFPLEKNEKEENDIQLLNKKRKHSDGIGALKKDLLEKMPEELKNVVNKYNMNSFNNNILEKYRFYKKYGNLNVNLLK